jgi:hypothetical protein
VLLLHYVGITFLLNSFLFYYVRGLFLCPSSDLLARPPPRTLYSCVAFIFRCWLMTVTLATAHVEGSAPAERSALRNIIRCSVFLLDAEDRCAKALWRSLLCFLLGESRALCIDTSQRRIHPSGSCIHCCNRIAITVRYILVKCISKRYIGFDEQQEKYKP